MKAAILSGLKSLLILWWMAPFMWIVLPSNLPWWQSVLAWVSYAMFVRLSAKEVFEEMSK